MAKPTVVLTYPIHKRAIDEGLRPFARVLIQKDPDDRAELKRLLSRADALITRFLDPVDEALLSHAPRLRVVGNCAVGYDNIDLKACARRGIRVVNTPGVLTRATAELTIALIFAAARRFHEGETLCRTARFKGWAPDLLLGLELKGRHAVLVGRGRIGQETARMLKALGIRVSWVTRADTEAEIQRKLSQAQILSFHCSLNPSTHHWLNAQRLAYLPPDALVINTTRGPVIHEKALIRALKARRIFAAGLDVFENEPAIPAELRKLPNTVLLPHLGSATDETREAMARMVISGVIRILSGKHPPNEVRFRLD